MSILEELIAPLTLTEFFNTHLYKEPFASPEKANRFRKLISWPLLFDIFASGHADCWLPKEGQLPSDPALATGRLTMEQAIRGFEDGRTVLVRHAERAHPALTEIARDFHNVFRDPVDIQLYCTPAQEEGFDWHYDAEEVFVIQSSGEKEFRLRKSKTHPAPLTTKLPKSLRLDDVSEGPEIRCLLRAGDWLYIPSGYWHKARALTPSFHLSVGVMALNGISYLKKLLPELEERGIWRQRFPVRAAGDAPALERNKREIRAMLEKLSENISGLLSDEERLMKFTDALTI